MPKSKRALKKRSKFAANRAPASQPQLASPLSEIALAATLRERLSFVGVPCNSPALAVANSRPKVSHDYKEPGTNLSPPMLTAKPLDTLDGWTTDCHADTGASTKPAMHDESVNPEDASMTAASTPFTSVVHKLNWSREDIEQRLGFRGGRFTSVNKSLTFLLGVFLTVAFYAALLLGLRRIPEAERYVAMFVERGLCPYFIVLLFFWAMAILWIKAKKLSLQERALDLDAVPQTPDFELTSSTARVVLNRLHQLVDSPANFVLLNRVERTLSNLRNIGQVSDVSSILATQSSNDEAQFASGYTLLNGFIWATPVLGFIGTVVGLSKAIAGFGATLQASGDLSGIKQSLQGVTGGLSTAFEVTLVALLAALIMHMRTTFLQTREAAFLDACSDYCHKSISARLRLKSE